MAAAGERNQGEIRPFSGKFKGITGIAKALYQVQ
jgi:hypothetical protein